MILIAEHVLAPVQIALDAFRACCSAHARTHSRTTLSLLRPDLYQIAPADTPTSDEYVGCFGDTKARVMTDMLVENDMTPTKCRAHCEGTGALYFGTQVRPARGSLLSCVSERERRGLRDPFMQEQKKEEKPASPHGRRMCFTFLPHVNRHGCQAVSRTLRSMSYLLKSSLVPSPRSCYTPVMCGICCTRMEHPTHRRTTAFHHYNCGKTPRNHQYGNECFCGTSDVASDYEVNGKGTCHISCAGDNTVACGEFQANTVGVVRTCERPAVACIFG